MIFCTFMYFSVIPSLHDLCFPGFYCTLNGAYLTDYAEHIYIYIYQTLNAVLFCHTTGVFDLFSILINEIFQLVKMTDYDERLNC